MIATVEIAGLQGKLMFRLSEGSSNLDGMREYEPLDLPPLPEIDSRSAMQLYGNALARALRRHRAVDNVLDQCFDVYPPDAATLQFDMATSEAERYRWEALYEDPRFLALNPACTMRRIVSSGLAGVPPPCGYDGSIRIVALLSPAMVKCEREFRALASAFAAACKAYPDAGFELHAYVGEYDLFEQIQQEIADGLLPGVAVYLMPADTLALERALRDRAPQILHCFCHGVILDGVPILQFATRVDHELGEAEGSVPLSIARLDALQTMQGPTWLTVLNSCSGAAAIPRLNSMAATLTRSASAVTIGMAEQVHETDATLFSLNFYPGALHLIGKAVMAASAHVPEPLDLGPPLGDARSALNQAAELAAKEGDERNIGSWCLPVMYQRAAGLSLVRLPPPDQLARLKKVAEILRLLPANTPKELREQFRNLLDNDPKVDRALWPDLSGNYA